MKKRILTSLIACLASLTSGCNGSSSGGGEGGSSSSSSKGGAITTPGSSSAGSGGTSSSPRPGGSGGSSASSASGAQSHGGGGAGASTSANGGSSGGSSSGGTVTGGALSSGGAAIGGSAGGTSTSGGTSGSSSASGGSTGGTSGSGTETGGSGGTTGTAGSSGTGPIVKGPCDIYEAAAAPCVAAHSTTRALYAAYSGNLYQVRRADKALQDVGLLAPGGIADASVQEIFCANSKCTISKIYDQSPKKNDLTLTSGGWIGDRAKESDAFGIKIKLNGKTVYGIHITGETNMAGNGYRNNTAVGTAEGDAPESMYMVANGKNVNDKCCFDYGNAERNSLNNGPATMEAIYFGSCTAWGRGEGTGPWVMADLEEGLFTGKNKGLNAGATSLSFDYLTAMLKGKPHTMAIKAGDSQIGRLITVYEGAYPSGYDPMKKEGAIVLGTGGDNSFAAVGDFFEGAMTAIYTSDEVDEAVQANIVAAGYGR